MSQEVERYDQLQGLFEGARELGAEERRTYLDRHCADPALRREVEELLEALDEDRFELSEEGIGTARQVLEEAADGDAASTSWLPERIASYRVQRLLGQGGMGVVYEALQESPRRRVAIKLLRPAEATSERLKRFRQEAELLGRLQHPGIAQILEAGTFDLGHGAQPFFAMELVEGVDLRLYADRERLEVRGKLELLAKVADAVHHAHERGVVHRDLKPDNVLVDERGQPKVLDFGIARAKETSEVLSTLVTREGVLMGTLAYMAPEQLEGDAVTARTDVFALGVLAYELLTGRLPHEIGGLELPAALRVLEKQPTVALRVLAPELRGDVDTIVTKALTREPGKRYATAAAFAADLRRHLDNMPIEARPPSRLYRFRKYARRNRSIVAIAATLLFAVIVSAVFGVRTQRALRRAERTNYEVGMLTVSRAVSEGNPDRGLLDSIRPELGGWEWRHLSARIEPPRLELGNQATFGDQTTLSLDPPGGASQELLVANLNGDLRWLDLDGETVVRSARVPTGKRTRLVRHSPETGELLVVAVLENKSAPTLSDCSTNWWKPDEAALRERHAFRAVSTTLALHPGQDVLFGVAAGEAFLLDVDTGERLATCALVGAGTASWAPDGSAVLVGGLNGELWRLDGRTLRLLDRWPDAASSKIQTWPYLRAGGSHLAFTSLEELELWDLRPEPPLRRRLHESGGTDKVLGFSSSGELLASAHGDRLRLWDVETGRLVRTLPPFDQDIKAGAFVDGDRLLVTVNALGRVRIHSLEDPFRLAGHGSFVYRGAFAEASGLLVSGAWDGYFGERGGIGLWDARTGAPVARLGHPPGIVLDVEVLDGRSALCLVSDFLGGVDRVSSRLERLDLRTGARATLWEGKGRVSELAVSPDGARAGWVGAGQAVVFDLEAAETEASFEFAERVPVQMTGIEWSDDGAWLAVGNVRELALLDGRTLAEVARWQFDELLQDLDLDPSGERAAVALDSGDVLIARLPGGERVGILEGPASSVYSASYSPDGARIATGARDGVVRIWDAETHALLAELRGHDDYVYSLEWSDDGETLVSSSGDATLRMWTTETETERRRSLRERDEIVARVEPVVVQLLEELVDDVAATADRLDELLGGPTGWTPREREVAGQVLLGRE